ncbi:hypothetical protein [Halarchaeum sp. P4]|uniref:hypothetical protein n=1 Tax=Halarchaeum sp. P4 TaxID=3421639 RepID=UPI003EB73A98
MVSSAGKESLLAAGVVAVFAAGTRVVHAPWWTQAVLVGVAILVARAVGSWRWAD